MEERIYELKENGNYIKWRTDAIDGNKNPCGTLINYISKTSKTIVIPQGVTKIEPYCFSLVEKEGEFEYEPSLVDEIFIPQSVVEIEDGAFGCVDVKIKVDDKNKHFCVRSNVLLDKDNSRAIAYSDVKNCFRCIVPDGVRKICSECFSGAFVDVELPESVNEICQDAFSEHMGTLLIPQSEIKIHSKTFGDLKKKKKEIKQRQRRQLALNFYAPLIGTTIKTPKNSTAHKFAKKNKIQCVLVSGK
ncbi:MAG: leucine-rich repeat protein [Clostridia bacterium]|nr:leucine-rich repeat protein [Clostridia bacterium]